MSQSREEKGMHSEHGTEYPFLRILLYRYKNRSTMWLLLGAAVVAFLLVLLVLPETYRHHIDEVKTIAEDDDDEAHYRSHIHSTHSDPTLVASKTSLHDSEPSIRISRDRRSIYSTHSHKSRNGEPIESAMEFIVPNYVPVHMMTDDEPEASTSTSSSSTNDAVVEIKGTPSEKRHVVFPCSVDNEKRSTAQPSAINVSSLKRKPFNPLRPLLCLLQPTNALLVTFNALSLAAQLSMNNTLPISFHDIYHLTESEIGACFCVAGLGSVMGSLIGGRYSDYVMRKWLIKEQLKRQRDQRDREAAFGRTNSDSNEAATTTTTTMDKVLNEKTVVLDVTMRAPPEVRLRSVWLGVFFLPFGLMLFGWSVQNQLPLAAPLVGIFFIGFGMMMVFASTTTALVDANSDNNMATSAVACNSFARGLTGALGGFTALPMLSTMGSGWLYTFWALMTLVGSSGLVLMVMKAKSWRAKAAADKTLNRV